MTTFWILLAIWATGRHKVKEKKNTSVSGNYKYAFKQTFVFNPNVLASPAWSYKIQYSVLQFEPSDYMTL